MRTGTDARALENHEDALADAQHGLQEARRVSEVPRQSAREMHHEQGYAYGPDPAELHLLDGIVVRNQLHARGGELLTSFRSPVGRTWSQAGGCTDARACGAALPPQKDGPRGCEGSVAALGCVAPAKKPRGKTRGPGS